MTAATHDLLFWAFGAAAFGVVCGVAPQWRAAKRILSRADAPQDGLQYGQREADWLGRNAGGYIALFIGLVSLVAECVASPEFSLSAFARGFAGGVFAVLLLRYALLSAPLAVL